MSKIYTDGLEHLDLGYSESKFGPKAMQLRNQKARELRKEGWTVKCGKTSFQDLAGDYYYWIEAKREKR